MDDQSKQDLKPELKEIYERIMKTPVQGSTGTSTPPPTSPMPGSTTTPQAGSLMGSAPPKQEPFSSPASSAFARETLTGQNLPGLTPGLQPEASAKQPDLSASIPAGAPIGQTTETQMPKQEKPVFQQPSALEDQQPSSFYSIPPRPAQNTSDSSFVFSSTRGMQTETPMQTGTEQPQAQPQAAAGGNKILVTVAVIIFLAVYTVFWLIFFGVLDTSSLGLPEVTLPFSLPF